MKFPNVVVWKEILPEDKTLAAEVALMVAAPGEVARSVEEAQGEAQGEAPRLEAVPEGEALQGVAVDNN